MRSMRGILERIAMTEVKSLGVALVLCMLGHVTGTPRRDCGVDARPHPEGFCGDKLIRARDNLCFLLRIDYPTYFMTYPSKRSVDDLFNTPVHAFAEMNLFNDDEVTDSTSTPRVFAANPFSLTKAKRTLWLHNSKRVNIRDGGMVCDCCYNKCYPSVLAQYC